MALQMRRTPLVRRGVVWPLSAIRRSLRSEDLRIHASCDDPVSPLVRVGCHDEQRREGRQERQRVEGEGGERNVGHDGQENPPPQFQVRRRQGTGDEDPTHKDGRREHQRQVQCPHTDNDQRRQDHIPTPAQPARGQAVADHASDVDAIRGGNEPVLLLHGLRQHLRPERFVKVRRGGKVSGDVDRAFLLGSVDGGWSASCIDGVDGGWSASCIDGVGIDSVGIDRRNSRIDTVSDAQRAPLCTEPESAGTPHSGTS